VLCAAALALAGTLAANARPGRTAAVAPTLLDWPEFGLDAQRSNATDLTPGITAANVAHLKLSTVTLPGTADNSAIYVHDAMVNGATHDAIFVTTTYGITLAIDARSGHTLWTFTPPGIATWSGSPQITTASPIADTASGYVYATSPNGLVHKLAIADGREAGGWPVRITPLPSNEKLTASLNISGSELLASTGGYIGDAPPYVGHVVAISLAGGHVDAVFNTLCADRHRIIDPKTCPVSDSAILSRSGPVVEPGGTRLLIATGNAPYNGSTQFGDSVIELTLPGLRRRQAYTPVNQATLNSTDTDLGSGSPAVLPGGLALIGGKDGLLRVLALAALDGQRPGGSARTGGELQLLPTPGGAELFSTPAVWRNLVFVADGGGTAAYGVAGRRLHQVWLNGTHGTSPIVAGGLLYVYDMDDGGLAVYHPASGKLITTLPVPQGHWNSPIAVDGHVIEPTGDANQHATSGELEIFSVKN
jgi:outer membrane protein assembly factor BamB